MMKKTKFVISLLIGIAVSLTSISPVLVEAKEQLPVLIIQQIRGNEACCQAGSTEIFEKISNHEKLSTLPISWALRYDFLKDEDTASTLLKLPKIQSLGILLEITPGLATDSGVIYKGDPRGSDWYNGRNAFLIGYMQDERKKLIDTVFGEFHKRFFYYPAFTVSWMIDAWSLNYVRDTYGVRVHELTKEQYETDSYTLYGGIFNLPYWPSKLHPLLPAKTSDSGSDILIVRQTVSDLEHNYGSAKSFYTSQPNDYLANPNTSDTSYFISLLQSMSEQTDESRFALLGLENSQEWQSTGGEYLKQLEFVFDQVQKGAYQVQSPYEYYLQHQKNELQNQPRILKSNDFPSRGKLWYFSPFYRLLLENWDGKMVLTDLRIYGDFSDPYMDFTADKSRAYWIIPYAIDSSQQYSEREENKLLSGAFVRSDAGVDRFGISLSDSPITDFIFEKGIIRMSNARTRIEITPAEIRIEGEADPEFKAPVNLKFTELPKTDENLYFTFPRHPRFIIAKDSQKEVWGMSWETPDLMPLVMTEIWQSGKTWVIRPNLKLGSREIEKLAAIFYPDKTSDFNLEKSVFFWHNSEAIAGRNPVRLYIDARSSLDRFTSIDLNMQISNPEIYANLPSDVLAKMEPFLVDFTATQSAQAQVNILASGIQAGDSKRLYFYTDCTKKMVACLTNSAELKGFTKILFREKLNELLKIINKYREKYIGKMIFLTKN